MTAVILLAMNMFQGFFLEALAEETTQWYSALLQKAGEAPRALPGTKVAVLRAPVAGGPGDCGSCDDAQ